MREPKINQNSVAIRILVQIVVLLLVTISAGVIVSLFAGLLGRWHFLADLASHFRPQGVITLAGLGCLLFLFRFRKTACGILLLAGAFSISLLPYLIPRQESDRSEHDVRVMILNVLTSNREKQAVANYIEDNDPDMFLLMEVDDAWQNEMENAFSFRYPFQIKNPRADNFGISLFSKYPLDKSQVTRELGLHEVPSIKTIVKLPNQRSFQFIGTHPIPPMNLDNWKSRNQHLTDIISHKIGGIPTVVGGDFNCTPWSYHFQKFVKQSNLQDTALHRGIKATWSPHHSILSTFLALPIDHLLVSDEWSVCDREVGPYIGSDHRGVVVSLRFKS